MQTFSEIIKKLYELYCNGTIEQKRYIIGSIFPAKWTIFENKGRTEKVNLATLLIYRINNTLRHKKTELELKLELTPAWWTQLGASRTISYLICA